MSDTARFVNADKLSEKITTEYCGKCGIYNGELCCSCPMNDALNYIEEAPTVTLTETTDFGAMIAKTNAEIERLAKELDEHMKAMKDELWRPADDPPDAFFDENIELIPFLVCLDGTKLPFRAVYDGTNWSDGISDSVLPVKWWMPLPEPPRKEGRN